MTSFTDDLEQIVSELQAQAYGGSDAEKTIRKHYPYTEQRDEAITAIKQLIGKRIGEDEELPDIIHDKRLTDPSYRREANSLYIYRRHRNELRAELRHKITGDENHE